MENSLSRMRPHLVSEWSDKNLPLTPDTVTFGSNKIVWWKGACGHEWQTSIKARSAGEQCPICSGARVLRGYNDFESKFPELAKEWSPKNEPLRPSMITAATHRKVIWRCKLGHEWTASVKSRTVNGTGCPYCSHNFVLPGFNDLATSTATRLWWTVGTTFRNTWRRRTPSLYLMNSVWLGMAYG